MVDIKRYWVVAVIPETEEKQLMPLLSGCESSRWYPDFADITARNGGNDIPIVERAGIGVAMGNANDSLKAIADYVTDPVDENGVYHALKHWVF